MKLILEQCDELKALIDKGMRLLERFLKHGRESTGEQKLLRALVPILVHNRFLRHAILQHQDFYQGKRPRSMLRLSERLSTMLDPYQNGACKMLSNFFDVLLMVYPDKHICRIVRRFVRSVKYLLCLLEQLYYTESIHNSRTYIAQLWSIFDMLPEDINGERYRQQIESVRDNLMACFRDNSRSFYKKEAISVEKFMKGHGKTKNGKVKKTGSRRRFTDEEENVILDFVQQRKYDLDREKCGTACYDVKRAALQWVLHTASRYPRLPQTEHDFINAYNAILKRQIRCPR